MTIGAEFIDVRQSHPDSFDNFSSKLAGGSSRTIGTPNNHGFMKMSLKHLFRHSREVVEDRCWATKKAELNWQHHPAGFR